MKILYIENIRLPTEKAHGIQIMKMCEAFAEAGHEVVLLIPKRKNDIKGDPFEFYRIKRNFTIRNLYVFNILFLGPLGFWLQSLFFAERAAWFMWSFRPDVLYSREKMILFNFILVSRNMYWEVHTGSWNLITRILVRFTRKIVVISKGLENFFTTKSPELTRKMILAPDGVDIMQFTVTLSKEECRRKLGLPLDKKIALYAGHLYDWKGAYLLAEASEKFAENELAVFVGGTSYDVDDFKKKHGHVKQCLVLGQKPHSEIPLYLKSADVLVLPNSAKEDIGRLYTSPLKLFEYMASGIPIVASSVPAICEILNPSNATLFSPDDSGALLLALKKVFDENDQIKMEVKKKAEQARNDVKAYTWTSRAKIILSS